MAKIKPTRILIFVLFRIISFFVYIFPLRIGLVFGKYIGKLCFLLACKEKKKISRHLDIAFGNTKSFAEKGWRYFLRGGKRRQFVRPARHQFTRRKGFRTQFNGKG